MTKLFITEEDSPISNPPPPPPPPPPGENGDEVEGKPKT